MSKRWKIREIDSGLARSISSSARLPELVAALLVARGLQTPDAVKAFLNANLREHFRRPSQMPGCEVVSQALFKAIKDQKRIAVFGDYDVDGFTSAVILCKTLRDLGVKNVRYYIPCRLDEGYGLNAEAITSLKNEGWNTIVTVDNGIASLDEIRHGKQLGLEMLVSDHHIPGVELPEADAIAHPQLVRYPAVDGKLVSAASLSEEQLAEAKRYPFPQLCGGGVALKIALRLADIATKEDHRPLSAERVRELYVLATLATIADCVPLWDENRALVRTGLELLNAGPVSPGIDALLDVSRNKKDQSVDEEFIAFQMAPRLNAAGRLGQAGLAAELLWSEDRRRCRELAAEIDELNRRRKTMESEMQHEAEKQIREKFKSDDSAFVLDGLGWHKGVLGIVASRIAENYHRPTILLSRSMDGGPVVGSGRGMAGGEAFNLYEALQACEDLLVRFGGHDSAAGMTVEAKNVEEFRKRFVQYAAETVPEEARTAELFLDGEFPLGAFTRQSVEQISLLAPFGNENAKPIFAARNVTAKNVKPMGKDGKHFEADFQQGPISLRGIAFGRRPWVEEMKAAPGPIDIAFKVRISTFGSNYGSVELDILDWRPAE